MALQPVKPAGKEKDKTYTLTSDEARLVSEVIKKVDLKLSDDEWEQIATSLGIWNATAAEAHFKYLMDSFAGVPKSKKRKKNEHDAASDEHAKRPAWLRKYREIRPKLLQVALPRDMDGTGEDFKQAERRLSVDELLLMEREE